MAQAAEHTEAHVLLAGDSVRNESDGSIRLVGGSCGDCGALFFPSAQVCPECMSEAVVPADLASEGTLYSWSVVHVAPKGWNTPYIAGYVDLEDGVRVFAHITGTDASALEMDMPVSLTSAVLGDDDGVPVESYAFEPARG